MSTGWRRHLRGAPNAILFGVSSTRSESNNAFIQRAKRNACGRRGRERFRAAILFPRGGRNLSPEPAFPHGARQIQAGNPPRPPDLLYTAGRSRSADERKKFSQADLAARRFIADLPRTKSQETQWPLSIPP